MDAKNTVLCFRPPRTARHTHRHCDFVDLNRGVYECYRFMASVNEISGMADDWRLDCNCVCIGAASGRLSKTGAMARPFRALKQPVRVIVKEERLQLSESGGIKELESVQADLTVGITCGCPIIPNYFHLHYLFCFAFFEALPRQ
jgi:hypothetical protein